MPPKKQATKKVPNAGRKKPPKKPAPGKKPPKPKPPQPKPPRIEPPPVEPRPAGAANVLLVNMIPATLSWEENQDSEPTLALNPANPQQLVGTAFTPDPMGGPTAPIFLSNDGGNTWTLQSIVPSDGTVTGTGDISVGFGPKNLYSGILKLPGELLLNILRTADPSSASPMDVLSERNQVDQPFVDASSLGGRERVSIGLNDLGGQGGQTATIDQLVDGTAAPPVFNSVRIESRSTGSAGQNGPQVRPASAPDGTTYAAFYGWRAFALNQVTADVVVVRDDAGAGAAPFSALVDPGDGLPGRRVALNVQFVWNELLGNQRIGGDIAVAVDPTNSSIVYLAWADKRADTGYTLHLRRSTDRGETWSASDLRTLPNTTNPALAVNAAGKVAFLYQQVTGADAGQRWVTQVDRSNDGVNWDSLILATVPADSPVPKFQPYIGDYVRMIAFGNDFYGIFSANNQPDLTHFPNGVQYQRNVDFPSRRLLGSDSVNPVATSIDPFFFKITE